ANITRQRLKLGASFSHEFFHFLHSAGFIGMLLRSLRVGVSPHSLQALPRRLQLRLQSLTLTRHDIVESPPQVVEHTVGIVLTQLLLLHGPESIQHVLQARHDPAMVIRHATLHKHAQSLLQISTLEQGISEVIEHVFWGRVEGVLRAIPRGIAITDHAAGTPFEPRSYDDAMEIYRA